METSRVNSFFIWFRNLGWRNIFSFFYLFSLFNFDLNKFNSWQTVGSITYNWRWSYWLLSSLHGRTGVWIFWSDREETGRNNIDADFISSDHHFVPSSIQRVEPIYCYGELCSLYSQMTWKSAVRYKMSVCLRFLVARVEPEASRIIMVYLFFFETEKNGKNPCVAD